MYIVRNTFIAKPGSAGKFAKLMKESMPSNTKNKVTVMIDFVSDFNKIVAEFQVQNLAEFEKIMEDFKTNSDPKAKDKMKGYTEMYLTGKREIFKVID